MNKNQCNICGAYYECRNGKWICPACDAVKPGEITDEEDTLLCVATQERQLKNFDEAERKYSYIIERYPKNAESYFGRVLSKYGIIYEEDYDGRNIPTCCATSLESFLDDKDYLKALELADKENKRVYQEHAEYIEKARKEWVEKVKGEEAYDIFISYKDSDKKHGIDRTEDSINALELYNHLARQGYRVFYSRESLRDKIGEKYEPYIFNALNTSKVMILYGSSVDYINSTWVKNEWQRYLKKIENGEKRDDSLLVACEGFSPKELPSVLAKKQCLDAKARSFYTDLDNRIKELVKNLKVERGSIRKYKVEKINVEELVPAKKQEIKQFDALHEHNFKKVQVVPSTCNSQGYTLFRCDCGEEKKTDFTPKRTSHEWQLAERKEPTCINNGYELCECKYCDATDKKILTATGHDEFVAEEKEATCFEEGYRKYECKICGHTRFEPISKTNHEYGDWVITKHPTCVENGEETRQCKNCPNQQKRELPAKGHSFSKWIVKTEPTCNNEGIEHRQCKTCGKIEERSLPKRKHKYSAWQNSKDGIYKERLCEYCGKVDKVLTEEYIRQRNKKKARVLEIIACALFAMSGIAALVGTIIFFANCYDLRVFIYCSWWLSIPFCISTVSVFGAIISRWLKVNLLMKLYGVDKKSHSKPIENREYKIIPNDSFAIGLEWTFWVIAVMGYLSLFAGASADGPSGAFILNLVGSIIIMVCSIPSLILWLIPDDYTYVKGTIVGLIFSIINFIVGIAIIFGSVIG